MSRRYESTERDDLPEPSRQQLQSSEREHAFDPENKPSRGSSSTAAQPRREQPQLDANQRRSNEPRTPYRERQWTYSLRASEIQTLQELGTFRAVGSEALAEIGYAGSRDRMEQDLRNLIRQSLITRRSVEGPEKERFQVLTLTKAGQRLLTRQKLMPKDQPIYHGLVKTKEARHDATLYRLYHKAARQIEREGGKVRKVALDYELKKHINKELARLGADGHTQDKKSEIAEAHGVRVINGRVVVPDLQIEYENAEGQLARVNLELATKNYRAGQLQAKAQAGFTLYATAQDADRLRRVLNEREITAEILNL